MPIPNTVNDTVGYTPKNIYACEDVLVDIDDGNRLDIYGDVYLNGNKLASSGYDVGSFGAVGNGATNDAGAIQRAIDAAYAAGGGTVVLGAGKNYRIASEIFVKNYVNLIGATSGQGSPSCISTSGTGRIRFGDGTAAHAYGGDSGNFTINGAAGGDATGLLVTNHNAHCTFNTIEIDNAPGVGMRVSESQNCVFIGINIQGCVSDGLILDRGCGGNLFLRVEINQVANYHLRFIGGVGGVGTYIAPTQNSFHHCIFERALATQSKGVLRSEACASTVFDNCAFVSDVVGRGDGTPPALIDMDGSSDITLRDCFIQGVSIATGQSGIYAKSAVLNISNRLRIATLNYGVTLSTGVSGLWDYVTFSNIGTNVNLVDSSNRNNIARFLNGGLRIGFDDTMPNVFQITKDGEANPRFSFTNLGNMWWGPGGATAVDTWMQRWGVNSLKTNGEFVIGGNLTHQGTKVGFNNTAPVVKPTVSGAKASNAALASLLTALASMGLITDSSTA